MQKFSNRLVSLRKERGLTQEALAKIVHLKRSTLSGYESEGKEPNLETVCMLAEYFGVTCDYLLGRSDRRAHVRDVFYNDNVNFQKHLNSLPQDLRPPVAKCFDDFYRLLVGDVRLRHTERIELYEELLNTLQTARQKIQHHLDASGPVLDPVALSDLMLLQSTLKNELSSCLDRLLQADMEISLKLGKRTVPVSPKKKAM